MKFINNLADLPSPPFAKFGWPWTEESDSSFYSNKSKIFPKISVVTPSYNQGYFLEETIRSILLQNYPNLELIIIDGGSTDNTLDIIKKYEPWITYWVSEKDRGQSHALNKGFEKATGELVGWQNSDDIYLPNAFYNVALSFNSNKQKFDIFYGKITHIDEYSNIINKLYLVPFSFFVFKYYDINVANQGIFFKNEVVKKNAINENYTFTMDAEYYFRLAFKGYKFKLINNFVGAFRIQKSSKTSTILDISIKETNKLRRSYGVNVIDGIEWKKQFRFQKFLSILYILPFKVYYGGLFYYLKKR
jgi:glycosyltransferase involved in cell wall biosynthesis